MSGEVFPTKKIWNMGRGENTPEWIVNERNENLRLATLIRKTQLEKAWHMGRAEWFQKRLVSGCPVPERTGEEVQSAIQRYWGRDPVEVFYQFVREKKESDEANKAMKKLSLNDKPDEQKGKPPGGRGM